MAFTISLTTHFTVTASSGVAGVDSYTITGGSTSTADTISLATEKIYDQRFVIANNTLQLLWNDDNNVSDFDFLWIEADKAVEIQLLCSENGVIGTGSDGDLENGFVIKLTPGIPFVLSNDDSRNRGDVLDTLNAANYATEMDNWYDTWVADTIDRIQCFNSSGESAEVRIFVGT